MLVGFISWLFSSTSFLHTVILSISLQALHLNKHASFLLCDRLLLMNKMCHSIILPSLPVQNNHVLLTLLKELFSPAIQQRLRV